MVDFRIDNPQYFLVTPLVINNSLSTYLLQIRDKITLKKYCKSSPAHSLLWKSGQFATALHEWFIEKYLSTDKYPSLYVGKQEMGMTRFSINAILWFGAEMKKYKELYLEMMKNSYRVCIQPLMACVIVGMVMSSWPTLLSSPNEIFSTKQEF